MIESEESMNQKSNKTVMWILLAVVGMVLIGGVVYALTRPKDATVSTTPAPAATTTQETTTSTTESQIMTPTSTGTTITYTDNGFSPSSYTAKVGSTITVINNSKMDLEFSSDDHPAHTDYTELNMGTQKPGESVTFNVSKTGSWGFHDHLHAEYTGTLVVNE